MRSYQYFFSCPTHPYTSVDKAYADFCTEFEDKVETLHDKYIHKDADTSGFLFKTDGAPRRVIYHPPALTQKQLIEYINILIKGRKPSYVATRAAFDFEQQTFINDDYTTYETTT